MTRTRSGGSSRAVTLECSESTKKKVDKRRADSRKKGRPREKEKVDEVCPICKINVEWGVDALQCEECEIWVHKACLCMSDEEYEDHKATEDDEWFCDCCQLNRSNSVTWGTMFGEGYIRSELSGMYDEIITWSRNIFMLPRGKSGERFIKELTRLLYLFVNKTAWENLSLQLVHVFIPLMLQKPASTSKARDHAKYLLARLEKWTNGDLKGLLDEARVIQEKLKRRKKADDSSRQKGFSRLMMVGKVGQAMKLINNEDSVVGVHTLNRRIKSLLQEKHPEAQIPPADILLPVTAPKAQPVVFEEISAELVEKAALRVKGSGGPTHMDSDGWKHILCSKSYGRLPFQLCGAIAEFANRLCTEEVNPECLNEFVACRLVPLNKGDDKNGNPGVRPVGVGEVLRRIVGKVVIGVIKDEIQEAAGPLQSCAGLESGIEASIHAVKKTWDEPTTEAVLLVDADNAFNRLNRKAAIHNIRQLCPPFHQYLKNTYQKSAKLIVNDSYTCDFIYSDEGATQGDVAAMEEYAIGIRPLINILATVTKIGELMQAWYADDSAAAGTLRKLREWWDLLCVNGPKLGYFPKAVKTILILKDKSLLPAARFLFGDTGIEITCDGERHLGAVIGGKDARESYVKKKVEKWVKDLEELSEIALDEPQAALSGFTKALCHRWTFVMRTIQDTKELFIPLENCIREKFIPSIIGRCVSDLHRRMFALPVRFGGLGMVNPVDMAEREYQTSVKITEELVGLIYRQETSLKKLDKVKIKGRVVSLKLAKELRLKNELAEIMSEVDESTKESLQLVQEHGSGAWLTSLPIQQLGYAYSKVDFRDSLYLRYGWDIPNTPRFCDCGAKNDHNHILNCKRGGYVNYRHNNVRDSVAEYLRLVTSDVKIEPLLTPIESPSFQQKGNNADKARLDISARGVWSTFEKTFFDVRIFNAKSLSYRSKTLPQLYSQHEKEKKSQYMNRVLQLEKGSFVPLVFTTTGGMAPEAKRFIKRLAAMISAKTKEDYSQVISNIRTRLSMDIMRSVLVGVRGVRGKAKKAWTAPLSSVSFNLIPEEKSYEG